MDYERILKKLERLADDRESRRKRTRTLLWILFVMVAFFLAWARLMGIKII